MILFTAATLGAIFGAYTARKRKGALLDILQYAAVYAIAFSIIGLFVTVIIERSA